MINPVPPPVLQIDTIEKAPAPQSLSQLLDAYGDALQRLPRRKGEDLHAKLLDVLIIRDQIASRTSDIHSVNTDHRKRIIKLDQELKSTALMLDVLYDRSALAVPRDTFKPTTLDWWWRLDEHAVNGERKVKPIWTILAGFFLTLSLSFSADISRRFLGAGPDFLSVFSIFMQGVLALIAGSALVTKGQRFLDSILYNMGVKQQFQQFWKLVLALAVLGIILSFRSFLPLIANFYNDQGVRLQRAGQVTSAIDSYQRALSLNPDFDKAHYNLGDAYEEILDYTRAMSEYQSALKANPHLYFAYNNLARLYILQRKDYAGALKFLNTALASPQLTAPEVQYSLYKNRGWANLKLEYLGEAEKDLKRAISLKDDGGSAHCLLAQVYEAEKTQTDQTRQAAANAWGLCLAYETDFDIEADWISLARERLSGK